jgi:hypothetical protein
MGDGVLATVGTGSSGGAGTSFAGGTAFGANLFGTAGGLGSGNGTIAATVNWFRYHVERRDERYLHWYGGCHR